MKLSKIDGKSKHIINVVCTPFVWKPSIADKFKIQSYTKQIYIHIAFITIRV